MGGLQKDGRTERGKTEHVGGKKAVKVIVVIVVFVILLFTVFQTVARSVLEKRIIEEQISQYMEEIRTGYLSEMDYDIPSEIYSALTGELNPTVKSIVDYVLGDEESLRQGWRDIMEYMEYSVDSVERDNEGNYVIGMTFANRNLAMILSKTTEDMNAGKTEWIFGAISGNADEKFWESFRNNRNTTKDMVSKSFQFRIMKDEKGNWGFDTENFDFRTLGAMAGLEDKYLESSFR